MTDDKPRDPLAALTLPTGEPRTISGRALLGRSHNATDELCIARQALVYAIEAIEHEAIAQERRRATLDAPVSPEDPT